MGRLFGILKKTASRLFRWVLYFGIALIVVEVAFRFQWVDFYKRDFEALNATELTKSSPVDLLVFGDSFAGAPDGFVYKLREIFPEKQIYNSCVSGTGIRQTALFWEDRIEQVKPKQILYQVYVGNDLTDIDHPQNWSELSIARNLYWGLTDHFLTLQYTNSKLGAFKSNKGMEAIHAPEYIEGHYNTRCLTYVTADPHQLRNDILLQGPSGKVFLDWCDTFEALLEDTPDDVKVHVLVIPHCTQVHPVYRERYTSFGAILPDAVDDEPDHWAKAIQGKFPDVNVISVLDTLRSGQVDQFYLPNDPHFTPEGHAALLPYLEPILAP